MVSLPVEQKHIVLGVTGSIAAYKAVEIASRLTQMGGLVDVVLTASAEKFITPLTFQSVTGRRAYTDADLWGNEGHVTHIQLGHYADLLVIAPASAQTIARLANGMGDNLLSVTALASHCPILLAPAMDGGMYQNPATQANITTLQQRGVIFIGPACGHLASGLEGLGRLCNPTEIIGAARYQLSRGRKLNGKKVVVTAGGTQEAIDPVRYIGNRSSGKQGFAVAQAFLDEGADVILIAGRNDLTPPFGCSYVPVVSALDMLEATLQAVENADVLVMAAAVADFRLHSPNPEKIKKDKDHLQLDLEQTTDILKEISKIKVSKGYPHCLIGFAAESQNLLENAALKLRQKGLDMIVANDITATATGFEVDNNKVTLLFPDGQADSLPVLTKSEVAEKIVHQACDWLK